MGDPFHRYDTPADRGNFYLLLFGSRENVGKLKGKKKKKGLRHKLLLRAFFSNLII